MNWIEVLAFPQHRNLSGIQVLLDLQDQNLFRRQGLAFPQRKNNYKGFRVYETMTQCAGKRKLAFS